LAIRRWSRREASATLPNRGVAQMKPSTGGAHQNCLEACDNKARQSSCPGARPRATSFSNRLVGGRAVLWFCSDALASSHLARALRRRGEPGEHAIGRGVSGTWRVPRATFLDGNAAASLGVRRGGSTRLNSRDIDISSPALDMPPPAGARGFAASKRVLGEEPLNAGIDRRLGSRDHRGWDRGEADCESQAHSKHL